FRDGPVTIEGRTNLDTQAWYTGRLVIGVFDERSPAGRYPFSRFMASPSRAKRSELEHDSLASTLPGSIGGEAVVANMDGPDSRQRHVLGMRFGMGRKPPPATTFADLLAWLRFLLLR